MTFQISFKNFRTFHTARDLHVRPITLLTGGNSAGKSSFLAGLRYLSDLCGFPGSSASFNKDPFFLGAYDQVAHHRGGRAGRAKEFSLEFSGSIPTAGKRGNVSTSVSVEFVRRLSQAAIRRIVFDLGTSKLTASIGDDWRTVAVDLDINGRRYASDSTRMAQINAAMFTQSPMILGYMLEGLILREVNDNESKSDVDNALKQFQQTFQSTFNLIPQTFYTGAPVRTRPLRTYDPVDTTPQSEGSHVPSQMAQLARSNPNEWSRIRESLISFGQKSSLFTDIELRTLGRGGSDPFQINVVINGPRRNIVDVGYGVSQALPIIFEIARRPNNSLCLLQQPEVHLHPEAQAALGTFFADEIRRVPGYFIVETHSDYLIDRIRRHVRDGYLTPEQVSILYFSRKELTAEICSLDVSSAGEIINAPESYREFFMREQLENLGF